MKFIYINGGAASSTGERALRMDAVDDLISIFNTVSYDYGQGDFFIGIKLLFVEINTGTSVVDLIGKRVSTSEGYVLSTRGRNPRFVLNRIATSEGAIVLRGSSVIPNGQFVSLLIQRKGGNNAGNILSSNYELFYNGVKETTTADGYAGAALSNAMATFNTDFKIGSSQSSSGVKEAFYVDCAITGNRALTQAEITAWHTDNIVPVDGAKGIWLMNSPYGATALDSSSVNENGQLTGYSQTEMGLTDTLDNKVWIRKDGIIHFAGSLTNNVKTFTAPFNCQIYKIGYFSAGSSTLAYSTDGTNYTSIVIGGSGTMIVSISRTLGQTLYIRATTGANPAVVEIFYEAEIEGEVQEPEPEDVDVILMWGQSNMRGTAADSSLLPSDRKNQPFCKIYRNTSNSFTTLTTATNQADNGKYGPEMEFCYQYGQLVQKEFYVIKLAADGAPLASEGGRADWFPSNNELYLSFKNYVNAALNLLRSQNKNPIIKFVIGAQGERDARTTLAANAYETNMNNLYNLWEADFGQTLKFVHVRLSSQLDGVEYPGRDTVRGAHESVAAADPTNIKWINVDDLAWYAGDGLNVHFDNPNEVGLRLFNKTQEF